VKYQRVPFTACGGDEKSAVGVETNFFSALAGQFCKSDLSKPQKRNLTNHDIPSMKRGLLGRTPPPTNKGWEGWNFEFDWIPGAPNCAGDCVGVFNDAVAKCKLSSASISWFIRGLIGHPDRILIPCRLCVRFACYDSFGKAWFGC
jgi:hypothetical protein